MQTEKFSISNFYKKNFSKSKQVIVEILQAHILSLNTNLKIFNLNSHKEKPLQNVQSLHIILLISSLSSVLVLITFILLYEITELSIDLYFFVLNSFLMFLPRTIWSQ